MKHLFTEKSRIFFIYTLFISLFALACSKDETATTGDSSPTPTVEKVVTTQQVADVTTNAVSPASYGLQSSIAKALQTAVDNKVYTATQAITCGITISNNYSVAQAANGYSYKYSINGNYKAACSNAGSPSTFNYTFNMEGNYETPKLSSNDKAQAELTFESIPSSSTNVIGSGTYTRNGSQTSKEQGSTTFTSVVEIALSNLIMNKNTAVILSGTGAVKIATTSAGITKNYTGEITFKGNGVAILVIDGIAYTINL